jgi:DNA sulfur modification protein DndE
VSLETIRLSQRAKDQLVRVKRDTKIKNWNVLCRWALCVSLAERSSPTPSDIPSDSSVEMSWKTFGGPDADLYLALIVQRCHEDGLGTDEATVERQFRLHLHRGIGYLFGDPRLKELPGLLERAMLD